MRGILATPPTPGSAGPVTPRRAAVRARGQCRRRGGAGQLPVSGRTARPRKHRRCSTLPPHSVVPTTWPLQQRSRCCMAAASKTGRARAFGHVVGVGVQGAHGLGHFGVGHLHQVVQVLLQHGQRTGVGNAHRHAVGQPGGHGCFHHAAGGQRVGVGRGAGAHHAHDARLVAQRQLGPQSPRRRPSPGQWARRPRPAAARR